MGRVVTMTAITGGPGGDGAGATGWVIFPSQGQLFSGRDEKKDEEIRRASKKDLG